MIPGLLRCRRPVHLMHPERLHARRVDRRFMPEAIAVDVHQDTHFWGTVGGRVE